MADNKPLSEWVRVLWPMIVAAGAIGAGYVTLQAQASADHDALAVLQEKVETLEKAHQKSEAERPYILEKYATKEELSVKVAELRQAIRRGSR